jgi:hypothetical protein
MSWTRIEKFREDALSVTRIISSFRLVSPQIRAPIKFPIYSHLLVPQRSFRRPNPSLCPSDHCHPYQSILKIKTISFQEFKNFQ